MFTSARFAEVVDHGFHSLKRPRGVGPQVRPVRLAVAGLEHLHRCLVGMQHAVLEHLCLERIHQRLQAHPADAHPLRQGRSRDGQTGTPKDRLLAVQRQVVQELGHQHVCQ